MIPDITAGDTAGNTKLLPSMEPSSTIARNIAHLQMSTPLLLFLASHRPLTFVTGQMLYLLAPCAAILGWEDVNNWAALLSAPDANQSLTAMLTTPPTTSQIEAQIEAQITPK